MVKNGGEYTQRPGTDTTAGRCHAGPGRICG